MASVDGANKLVQALGRSLAMQINADMEKCTDKYVYGGIGRTALRRRSGQTLSQWIEIDEDSYYEL